MLFTKAKALLVSCAFLCAAPVMAAPIYTYVGSWIVGDGPDYATNPTVYSGRDAAAFLFGGSAADYRISTVDNDPAHLNFRTFLDGYGDDSMLFNPGPDDFKLSSNGGGYEGDPSYSAYVLDHTCFNRYIDISASCQGDGTQFVNYAFRVSAGNSVPEPGSLLLFSIGLAGLALRQRKMSQGN